VAPHQAGGREVHVLPLAAAQRLTSGRDAGTAASETNIGSEVSSIVRSEETRVSKIVVFLSVTLDGVMQAPARPDEDTRDGFDQGGWAGPYADAVSGSMAAEGMGSTGALLFGRRTYEDFYSVWPGRTDNPFSRILDDSPKYVASRTLTEPLPWVNSILLKGDAEDSVAALRDKQGKDIVILGSGELVRSLLRRNLVDRLILLIHPLVLGSGRRLFDDFGPTIRWRLADSRPTTTGVIIATYEHAAE
jgi:dihydrofolate reductase